MKTVYELLSDGDVGGFGELLAGDFVEHEEISGVAASREDVLEFFRMQFEAFPDMKMVPEDIIVSEDKVVARVRATGTHRGEFMGLPATGRTIDVQLIDIMRFGDDGLAHEHWGVFDAMAMVGQLGAMPEGPPT